MQTQRGNIGLNFSFDLTLAAPAAANWWLWAICMRFYAKNQHIIFSSRKSQHQQQLLLAIMAIIIVFISFFFLFLFQLATATRSSTQPGPVLVPRPLTMLWGVPRERDPHNGPQLRYFIAEIVKTFHSVQFSVECWQSNKIYTKICVEKQNKNDTKQICISSKFGTKREGERDRERERVALSSKWSHKTW